MMFGILFMTASCFIANCITRVFIVLVALVALWLGMDEIENLNAGRGCGMFGSWRSRQYGKQGKPPKWAGGAAFKAYQTFGTGGRRICQHWNRLLRAK